MSFTPAGHSLKLASAITIPVHSHYHLLMPRIYFKLWVVVKRQLSYFSINLLKIAIRCWGVGAAAIIFLAGLQGIPSDFYEAADQLESQNHVQQQVGRKMGKHSGF